MKKIILTFSLSAVTLLAIANYRVTGTIYTECGAWTYIIHPADKVDEMDRLIRLHLAILDACDDGVKFITVAS